MVLQILFLSNSTIHQNKNQHRSEEMFFINEKKIIMLGEVYTIQLSLMWIEQIHQGKQTFRRSVEAGKGLNIENHTRAKSC